MGVSAAATVAIIGTVAQVNEQRQARQASQRSADAEARQRAAQIRRERRQAQREARIREARLRASTAVQGAAGSSTEITAVGSIRSQLASNIQNQRQTELFQNEIYDAQGQQRRHQGRADLAGGISNIALNFSQRD